MDQSKQGHGKGKEGKRKPDDEEASNGSNGHDDFPAELAAQVQAASDAENPIDRKGHRRVEEGRRGRARGGGAEA